MSIESNRVARGRQSQELTVQDRDQNQMFRALRKGSTPLSAQKEAVCTAPTVLSIGYEGRSAGAFVQTLLTHGVTVLVDVRENAISRKPGFSKTALAELCRGEGIEYRHEKSLGNPKSNRDGFRLGERSSVALYRKHLSVEGSEAIVRLGDLLKDQIAAVLCFEADSCSCHRSIVIEELKAANPNLEVIGE
jgi:uncharacterized protein (DUF488 family)